MQIDAIKRTTARTLWAAAGVIVFAIAVTVAEPRPSPQLDGGFDSVTIAAELASNQQQLASRVAGQEKHLRISVFLDFPLILAYTALFFLSARLEMARGGWI